MRGSVAARARDRVSAASLTVLDGKASVTLNAEEKKSSTQIADATKADSGKKNTVKL